MLARKALRRLTLVFALLIGVAFVGADLKLAEASQRPSACKTKKKKTSKKAKKSKRSKKVAKRSSSKKKAKKMSYKSVLSLHKKGVSDQDILAKAQEAGYKPSKRDQKILAKKKVSPELIAAMSGKSRSLAKAEPKPKKIELEILDSPNDIDFDSVPPPKGMPGWVNQNERTVAQNTEKKKIDRSLRPAAPFDEGKRQGASEDDESAPKRRVIVAN